MVLTFLSKSGSVAWCVDACVVEEDLDWIDLLSASKTAARVCFVSFPFPHRSCTPSPRVPAVSLGRVSQARERRFKDLRSVHKATRITRKKNSLNPSSGALASPTTQTRLKDAPVRSRRWVPPRPARHHVFSAVSLGGLAHGNRNGKQLVPARRSRERKELKVQTGQGGGVFLSGAEEWC